MIELITLALLTAVAFYLTDKRTQKKIAACINSLEQAKIVSKNSRREIKRTIQKLQQETQGLTETTRSSFDHSLERIEEVNKKAAEAERLVNTKVEEIEFELFKLNNPVKRGSYFLDEEGDRFQAADKNDVSVFVCKKKENLIEVNLDSFYADWFKGEITIDDK